MAHPQQRTAIRKALLRFVLALGVLLALSHAYGKLLTAALLPVFRWEITQLDDTYQVLDLSLSQQGADSVVRLEVGLAHMLLIGGRVLYPDPQARANVSTLVGHITQPAILGLAFIFAWPTRKAATEYPVRVLMAGIGIALVILADVPFVLWAELWDIHVTALEPDRFSLLLQWRNFLQGGGRFVLGLAIGVAAVLVGQALTRRADKNKSRA